MLSGLGRSRVKGLRYCFVRIPTKHEKGGPYIVFCSVPVWEEGFQSCNTFCVYSNPFEIKFILQTTCQPFVRFTPLRPCPAFLSQTCGRGKRAKRLPQSILHATKSKSHHDKPHIFLRSFSCPSSSPGRLGSTGHVTVHCTY